MLQQFCCYVSDVQFYLFLFRNSCALQANFWVWVLGLKLMVKSAHYWCLCYSSARVYFTHKDFFTLVLLRIVIVFYCGIMFLQAVGHSGCSYWKLFGKKCLLVSVKCTVMTTRNQHNVSVVFHVIWALSIKTFSSKTILWKTFGPVNNS